MGTDMVALVKTGVIPSGDINNIHKVIARPSFARLLRYMIAVNDRRKNKDIDPRDAYASAMTEIITTMTDLVNALSKVRKEGQ